MNDEPILEPEIEQLEPTTYCCILTDITSGCNLRCKFCVQDWKQNKGNINMTKETFSKVIEIIPLAHDGWFFFSCGFESTIHPQFFEFFESIPESLKKKLYFTTNLAKKFTIDELKRLSKLNTEVFNISFESFNPDIYEEFRCGAKFKTFIHNVETLTSFFKEMNAPPHLRFISLLFNQNINEVESIVKRCQEEYGADENEFRTPFPWTIEYNDQEWMKKSLISDEDLEDSVQQISSLPYNIKLYNPKIDDENPIDESMVNLNFFVNADGSTKFISPETVGNLNGFNINSVDDPYNYLKDAFDEILELHKAKEEKGTDEQNEQEL